MKRWIIFFFFATMLAACKGNLTPTVPESLPSATSQPTDVLVPSSTILPTRTAIPGSLSPTPTEKPLIPAYPQYRITAELDYGWKVLTAQQELTIPHPSSQPLTDIILIVQPNWYPGTFQLEDLKWKDGSPVSHYMLEDIRLRISLLEPWEPGTSKTLSMAFSLNIPTLERGEEFGPNPFGYTSRQINLTDWYPFVPPFVDGNWLVHNPWFYGEHLVYPVANYEVDFRLQNAMEGTLIASNAIDRGTQDIHRYQIEAARNIVFSVSPEYQVFQENVDGVTLLGYSFPFEKEVGRAAFEATVEAYKLYSQIYGPYPHESLTLVQADFLHGMEYDGLYFLSKAFFNTYDGTPASYLVAIAVHETAHQWFFGLVGNDQAMEPWLDEAMCTFTERLYYEKMHPDALEWWLEYRVNYYEPQGWIDSTIYDTNGYRPYRDAIYLNGMNFLTDLRSLVGEQVFMNFLRDYLNLKSNEIATAEDFFRILRKHSDVDWTSLKSIYFRSP